MASTGVQMTGENVQAVYAKRLPSFQVLPSSITSAQFVQPTKVEFYPDEEDLPSLDLKGHTIEELATMANVPVEVIKAAIRLRRQQLAAEPEKATTISPPSTTVEDVTTQSAATQPSIAPRETKKKVTKKPIIRSGHKVSKFITIKRAHASIAFPHRPKQVMNAPKEYYPAGYDKNFDDNFKSRIDLPLTSFHCGDQKHFPGLYSDPDLGCMVSYTPVGSGTSNRFHLANNDQTETNFRFDFPVKVFSFSPPPSWCLVLRTSISNLP